ncbi:hypothetical protein AC578_4285 [Pseudocercospora eumusae]|uniref:Mid2 domain-containing protein n=1 Tax=Pseudocercospora eumusae TaxID=321146 RepID=A0A139H7Y3_9PEZI|nr:hypothetical protein AC578_4285 [Pseudocercospora eumusae]
MTTTIRAAAGILLGLHFILHPALAQNCYYPNGDVSTTDAACSSGDSACCPNNWECLSNGLCYDPTNKYFNRNTCTDQTWESSDCPQYCTANNTAAGNEALKQCDDGSWCCNGDRVHMDCCNMDDAEVIDVPGWTTLTKITSVPSPTSGASKTSTTSTTSSSSSSATTTTTSDGGSTTDSSSSTAQASPSDSTSEVPTTSSAPAAATSSSTDPPAASNGSSSKNLAIGLGVGIPLVALAAALGFLLLWQRKKKAKQEPPTSDRLKPGDPDMVDMYSHGKDAQEADSMPVAVGSQRDSKRPPSELIGNNHFLPTQQPSPTVSHTSSMSRFSNPPQYSPNPSLSRGGGGGGLFVVNPCSPLSDVDETPEPQELPPEGNPPRDSGRPTSIPVPSRTSAYEAYGRAYGPVATTYVPSPEPPQEASDLDGVVEGEQKPMGPRPQQQKRNDELMLD